MLLIECLESCLWYFHGLVRARHAIEGPRGGSPMETKVLRALSRPEVDGAIEDHVLAAKNAGYDGIECAAPSIPPQTWLAVLREHELDYVGIVEADDTDAFRSEMDRILPYAPILLSAQSGLDRMPFRDGCHFFLAALEAERAAGVPVAHETHRGRLLFTPWATASYLQEFPELRLCADFSHWCLVCGSMLDDNADEVQLACEHALHIHARVGSQERLQVADPRAPECAGYLDRYERWWDAIREARRGDGAPAITVTPRCGPLLGHAQVPAHPADPADLCDWLSQRIRRRWNA